MLKSHALSYVYGSSLSLVDFWGSYVYHLPAPHGKGPVNRLLLPTAHVGCSLGVSQLAKMPLPLAESLIMVLETPAWLCPALVSASK